MYFIDFRPYGYEMVFSGKLTPDELVHWLDEARRILPDTPEKFGLLVDFRLLAPLEPRAMQLLGKGLQLFQQKGLRRSAVVVATSRTKLEFTRQARESGIDYWERYLCPEDTPNWRWRGLAWIQDGVDPDSFG
jgi:hypothetical protein